MRAQILPVFGLRGSSELCTWPDRRLSDIRDLPDDRFKAGPKYYQLGCFPDNFFWQAFELYGLENGFSATVSYPTTVPMPRKLSSMDPKLLGTPSLLNRHRKRMTKTSACANGTSKPLICVVNSILHRQSGLFQVVYEAVPQKTVNSFKL